MVSECKFGKEVERWWIVDDWNCIGLVVWRLLKQAEFTKENHGKLYTNSSFRMERSGFGGQLSVLVGASQKINLNNSYGTQDKGEQSKQPCESRYGIAGEPFPPGFWGVIAAICCVGFFGTLIVARLSGLWSGNVIDPDQKKCSPYEYY